MCGAVNMLPGTAGVGVQTTGSNPNKGILMVIPQ